MTQSQASSPLPAPQHARAVLPQAGAAEIAFGGFSFLTGEPPAEGGVFVMTRRIGGRLFPLFIGEGADMAGAAAELKAKDPALSLADSVFWMARPNARQRDHVLRDLVGRYNPPLNLDHRKGPAAEEVAALAMDRASHLFGGDPERDPGKVEATEAELRDLVRDFYAQAMQDPLIGPVFARNVSDWDHHFEIVQDFWSRSLLGTTRYAGSPFTPHLSLALKPEFFDRWIALFKSTAETRLKPAAAQAAIARVEHMSVCFQAGLFPPQTQRRDAS